MSATEMSATSSSIHAPGRVTIPAGKNDSLILIYLRAARQAGVVPNNETFTPVQEQMIVGTAIAFLRSFHSTTDKQLAERINDKAWLLRERERLPMPKTTEEWNQILQASDDFVLNGQDEFSGNDVQVHRYRHALGRSDRARTYSAMAAQQQMMLGIFGNGEPDFADGMMRWLNSIPGTKDVGDAEGANGKGVNLGSASTLSAFEAGKATKFTILNRGDDGWSPALGPPEMYFGESQLKNGYFKLDPSEDTITLPDGTEFSGTQLEYQLFSGKGKHKADIMEVGNLREVKYKDAKGVEKTAFLVRASKRVNNPGRQPPV